MYEIRRVRPGDAQAIRDFYANLSPRSRYARFLGTTTGVSASQSLRFCTPDHMHAEGFVAESRRPGEVSAIVGHLCLEPFDATKLELAVAVADAEQGQGIGRALFRAALEWAAARGYESIVATCLADNGRVLSLLGEAPHSARVSMADGGLVEVAVPLSPSVPPDWRSPEALRLAAHRGARRRQARGGFPTIWRLSRRPATRALSHQSAGR